MVIALEYFAEKGWIDLQTRKIMEVYEILTKDIDIQAMTEKIYTIFKGKEKQEIARIHHMVNFFESNSCISKKLASYFGEDIEVEKCGHCSVCETGQALLEYTTRLEPLRSFACNELTNEFGNTIDKDYTAVNVTKFLCGISSPWLVKQKINKLAHFGILENYPYLDVLKWVEANLEQQAEIN